MSDVGLTRAQSTTEERQSVKGISQDLRAQANRLKTLVRTLDSNLSNAGLKTHDPDNAETDTPEPSDTRWILNDAATTNREALNVLEKLVLLVEQELV